MNKFLKFSSIGTLALTLVMWGCDSMTEPASQLLGPGETSELLVVERTSRGYTMARETDPSVGVVTAEIDQNGGVLNIGNHSLWIPAGAVTAPTTFSMTKFPGEIKLGLTATRVRPNDIGAAGFNKRVYLTLSYASAAELPQEGLLRVVWMKPDGGQVVMPSMVNKRAKVVVGILDHFSDYGVGFP